MVALQEGRGASYSGLNYGMKVYYNTIAGKKICYGNDTRARDSIASQKRNRNPYFFFCMVK
ncbi:hypothetical protein NQZ68_001556 [Dissostichus eleginoides]|nr:hypothetical protein NQZ68_001556 [Dissostichus eleginoides]